mmetsp:Transcript_28378/g.53662  ORF Transcript_28378/g.53662 Transcript_28378/m.53662 type:complete len:793 (+) Transcript_28378:250-2628(+)
MTPTDLAWAVALDATFGALLLAAFLLLRRLPSARFVYWRARSTVPQTSFVIENGSAPSVEARQDSYGGPEDETDHPTLLPALPADAACGLFGWVRRVHLLTEDELYREVGLDAVAFIRMHTLGVQLFASVTLMALPVVLPVNWSGQQVLDHTHNTWDARWTMAHVAQRSPSLWVHVGCCWVFTVVTFLLLQHHTKQLVALRLKLLARSQQDVAGYTILVQDIPTSTDINNHQSEDVPDESAPPPPAPDAASPWTRWLGGRKGWRDCAPVHRLTQAGGARHYEVVDFFESLFPGEVVQVVLVPQLADVEAAWRQCTLLRAQYHRERLEAGGRASGRGGHCDLVPVLDTLLQPEHRLQLRLERAEEELSRLRAHAKMRPACTAFVTFRARATAALASQSLCSGDGLAWTTRPAPSWECVLWPNLRLRWWQRRWRAAQVLLGMVLIAVWFMVPVTFVASLTTVKSIDQAAPFLKPLVDHPAVATLLQGYAPSVVLSLFLGLLPNGLLALSRWEGQAVTTSEVAHSASTKYFAVLLLNVFLGSVLTQTIFRQLESFLDHLSLSQILQQLGTYVPSTAAFFLSYVLFRALTVMPLELCQVAPLLSWMCELAALRARGRTVASPPRPKPLAMRYDTAVPMTSFMILVGLVFSCVGPVLLPGVLLYFVLARTVWLHQLTQVYEARAGSDSRGLLWMHMLNHVLLGLFLFHLILMGIFLLKESALTTFLLPLPVASALMYGYFRARFMNAFVYTPICATLQDASHGNVSFDARSYNPPCMRAVHNSGLVPAATCTAYHPI